MYVLVAVCMLSPAKGATLSAVCSDNDPQSSPVYAAGSVFCAWGGGLYKFDAVTGERVAMLQIPGVNSTGQLTVGSISHAPII